MENQIASCTKEVLQKCLVMLQARSQRQRGRPLKIPFPFTALETLDILLQAGRCTLSGQMSLNYSQIDGTVSSHQQISNISFSLKETRCYKEIKQNKKA